MVVGVDSNATHWYLEPSLENKMGHIDPESSLENKVCHIDLETTELDLDIMIDVDSNAIKVWSEASPED